MEDITRIQPIKRATLALRAQSTGELYELRGEMLVGREVECDIFIPSPQISRYHAKITVSANGVLVEDLQSSNGTYINGSKIHKRSSISIGDELCFDEESFRVTTRLSGNAEFTRVSSDSQKKSMAKDSRAPSKKPTSGDISSIEEIDDIHGDILKPAAPLKNEGYSRPTPKFHFDDEEPPLKKPAAVSKPPPPAKKPPIAPVPDAPRAQQIDDVEAFLRFAGSGLRAQEPLSPQETSPFGLAKQKTVSSNTQAEENSGISKSPKDTVRPSVPLSSPSGPEINDAQNAKTPVDKVLAENVPKAPVMEGASTINAGDLSARDKPQISSLNDIQRQSQVVRDKMAQALEASARAKPHHVLTGGEPDEERTKFLGLNAINRYVSTNQQFQQDLEVGSGPRLIAMTAPIRGKVFALQSEEDVACWSIGRDDSADICLRDQVVSREHAWITKLDALYQLRVNETSSGISVNGQTCTEADLHHGDRLQFGKMELVFRLDAKQIALKPPEILVVSWWQRTKGFFSKLFNGG